VAKGKPPPFGKKGGAGKPNPFAKGGGGKPNPFAKTKAPPFAKGGKV